MKKILLTLFTISNLANAASPGARWLLQRPVESSFAVANRQQYSVRNSGWSLGTRFFAARSIDRLVPFPEASVPEFLTWYPIEEVIRMQNLGIPLIGNDLDQLFNWNANLVGVLPNWSVSRFETWQKQFTKQANLHSLNELSRVLMNPQAAGHVLNQAAASSDCLKNQTQFTDLMEGDFSFNHSPCFTEEFPVGSVIAKLNWTALTGRSFKTYRTHSDALKNKVQVKDADWESMSFLVPQPTENEIITMELASGKRFALTGIHFMVKNSRDWTWMTFWWSRASDSDFQVDQPEEFKRTLESASNYSQCTVVSDHAEEPTDPLDLKQWIGKPKDGVGAKESWCSNPYLEHGKGNLSTNCIACHQYAGTKLDEGEILEARALTLVRNNFPTDYVWSFSNGPQAWARQLMGQ